MVCGEEGAVRVTECMCPVGGFKIEVVSYVRLVSTCGSQRQLDENHVSYASIDDDTDDCAAGTADGHRPASRHQTPPSAAAIAEGHIITTTS
ncbi:hypothetical protein JG688_00014528 [Phytophthora aleatoria]|uniref:Uncharacterized protein n=1 Tax=Phytophthora aleatoria TaxID=2496075 RepID=A0A8J5I772_9STRA|nr:hypothetical protein JG688_00014528 [Phytophthora aleatoria]